MDNIEKYWHSFKSQVIPFDASDRQLIEMRRAFYAGATSIMAIVATVSGDDVTEDQGVVILNNCEIELDNFANLVKNGKA